MAFAKRFRLSVQAEQFVAKKAKLFGGYHIIQEYEFNEEFLQNGEVKVLKFDNPCKEWAEFIFKNSNRDLNFSHDFSYEKNQKNVKFPSKSSGLCATH